MNLALQGGVLVLHTGPTGGVMKCAMGRWSCCGARSVVAAGGSVEAVG